MLRQGSVISQQLLSAAVQTASTNTPVVLQEFDMDSITFELFVAGTAGTTPTLDVYIQTQDNAGNWHDCCHFTQITANVAQTLAHYCSVPVADTPRSLGSVGSQTIAANSAVGVPILSRALRVSTVIGGSSPSFTITLTAYFNHQNMR